METYLELKWSISRAQDTYGYNRVTLTDTNTGKRFVACGGGYDMTGTVFADWLEANHQPQLIALSASAASTYSEANGRTSSDKPNFYSYSDKPLSECKLYGMTFYPDKNKVSLDGACGLNSILQIADCLGLHVKDVYSRSNRNPSRIGFIVTDKGAS